MAVLKKMPSLAIIGGFKGVIDYYVYMGLPCARRWPRSPGPRRAAAVQAQWAAWSYISKQWNNISPAIQDAYRRTSASTNLSGRDLFVKNYITPAYLELHESPPTPSPSGAGKWFATDIDIDTYPTEPRVTLETDIPCHLWLYWTSVQPVRHPLTRIRRGLAIPWYTRWCFVAWHEVEQNEPGDTQSHTFNLPDWLYCQTRYFTFRGTIADLLSPSVGPIFTHHMTAEVSFYPSLDGHIVHYDTELTWPELITGVGVDAYDALAYLHMPQIYSSIVGTGWLLLARSILLFDTSSIPISAVITKAELSLRLHSKSDSLDCKPNANVYPSEPTFNDHLIPQDYQAIGSIPLCDTPVEYDDWAEGDWHHFELNASGRATIRKGGITKLGVRNANYDVAELAPPWTFSKSAMLTAASSETISAWRPKLTVAYK